MTLLRRILHENRLLVSFVAGLLAIDFGLYVFAVYPWTNKVSQLRHRSPLASCS